ncbi:MAG: radical SAM protein [Candidatus Thorarchaeota archaeon]
MIEFVRISLGTAMVLGLAEGIPPEHFTTAFIMTYNEEGCDANCAFCPQAASSQSDPKLLSRIGWPKNTLESVVENLAITKSISRICIQTLNYENVVSEVLTIIGEIRKVTKVPVSICIHPIEIESMKALKEAGINNIGIAIDACTPSLFDNIKGKERDGHYTWQGHVEAIKVAQQVFGIGNVTTHLIVGLGETERQVVNFLLEMKKLKVRVGLFAFTSIKGTSLEKTPQPELGIYRRIQILRELLMKDKITPEQIKFDLVGRIKFGIDQALLRESLSSGTAFRVTGCPGCNRPFYNERPRGPMYNYPRPLSDEETEQAIHDAGLVN